MEVIAFVIFCTFIWPSLAGEWFAKVQTAYEEKRKELL